MKYGQLDSMICEEASFHSCRETFFFSFQKSQKDSLTAALSLLRGEQISSPFSSALSIFPAC